MDTTMSTILSMIASAAISAIIGTIIKRAIEKRLDKNVKDQQELLALRAEKERVERKEDVVETLRAELLPLDTKIDMMATNISLGMEGTVTLLRESMKQSRDNFIKLNCISASDYASWHELYNTYKNLGGNHFKEYVDAWKDDIENLPRI